MAEEYHFIDLERNLLLRSHRTEAVYDIQYSVSLGYQFKLFTFLVISN